MKNRFLTNLKFLIMALIFSASWSAFANQPDEGWFVRLIAESEAEGLVDRGNVLGELPDSIEQFDSHDLPELAPFSDSYLTVAKKWKNWSDSNCLGNWIDKCIGIKMEPGRC